MKRAAIKQQMNDGRDILVQIRMSDSQVAALDRWRGKLSPIPSRTAAICELVERGMAK